MDSILGDMTSFFDKKAEESGNIVCSTVKVAGITDVDDVPVENSKLTLFYNKLEQLNYNLDELKPILECDDSMLILSGAGSGKTTALILKVIRDLIAGETMKSVQVGDSYYMTPANILICTFLRTGAEELQKSFGDWCAKLGVMGIDKENIKFRTIHSEVLDALKGMGMDVKILEDGSSYMRQVMQSYGIRSVLSTGGSVTADEVSDMMLITNYARNRMDNRKYEHSLMADYGLDTMTLDIVLNTYAQHRKASGKMDFEDMQEILLDGLQKYERVREYIASRYDYIYVDEFQDTSQLQYEILKYYFDSAERVLCIGDDDQCIVKGSKVKTLKGIKNIEDVVVGDKVLSATGHGTVDYMPVNHVSEKVVDEKVYRVTTASGKTVTATGEHTAFARLVPLDNTYYVYLMYREDIGFRIGRTSGVRAGARQNRRNGIEVRCVQEKADKIWIIDSYDNVGDSIYYENYYSYLYSIPQYVFEDSKGKYEQNLSIEDIRKLHSSLNTKENGMRLLCDIGGNFDKPHYVPMASGNRVTLTHSLFGSSQILKATGVYKSELSATTNNGDYLDVLKENLHITKKRITNSDLTTFNARSTSADVVMQHSVVKNIVKGSESKDIVLNVVEQAKLTNMLYSMMPFSNLRKGMYMPVEIDGQLVDDVIVNIEKIDYKGTVYDLSVPDTVNFIVDDICVHNCIYSWRGSDIDIIGTRFEADYKPVVKNLSVNYRCAAKILAPVIPSIEKNKKRHEKKLRAARSGGTVDIYIDEDVNKLIEEVNKDIDRGYSTAILARTNNDLLVPAILLELNSKHNGGGLFSLSKAISLTSRIPKQVFGVMDLLLKRYNSDFEGYLKLFLPKWAHHEATTVANILAMNKRLDLFTIDKQDLVHSVPTLADFVQKLEVAKSNNLVEGYLFLLKLLVAQVYVSKTVYAQRAKDFVFFIQKIIEEHEEVKDMNLEELHTLFTETLPAKFSKRINSKQKSFIKLTTVHEAKGKEWDSVYIWNDFDGCFPNCVGGRELSEDEFEEERRVHYIAWTRARKKLTVFTLGDRMNGGFLKECMFDDYGFDDIMGPDLKSKTVFRPKSEIKVHKLEGKDLARKLLSDYIIKYSGGSVSGQKEGNCNLVIGEYTTDELWAKIESENAVYAYIEMDDVESYFSDFFERLAGDLIGERLDDISNT